MFKYIWNEHKKLILIITIFAICSIAIALGIYAQITNTKISQTQEEIQEKNYTELKNNFKFLFNNSVVRASTAKTNLSDDDIIELAYDITEKDSGKYDFNLKIPMFKLETKTTKKINKEINDTFVKKIISIVQQNKVNTIFSVDYAVFINDSILSMAIRSTLKEGSIAQRTIIQTYNYDLENDKLLNIYDILSYKGLDTSNVQDKINAEIKSISEQKSNIESQGYNVYKRNPSDQMYLLENADTFFLDNNSNLYFVYSYGNTNNTSEMDLVIF